MSNEAFILSLTAAILHASWHVGARSISGSIVVIWKGFVLATVLYLAIGPWIFGSFSFPPLSPTVILLILTTGVVHSSYFYILSKAYQSTEISFVYPITRAIGVVAATVLGVFLLGEVLAPIPLLGIAISASAIVCLGLLRRGSFATMDLLFGLALGLLTGTAAIVNKVAVSVFSPYTQLLVVYFTTVCFLAPHIVRLQKEEKAPIFQGRFKEIVFGGPISMLTYLLVLLAFTQAPVSYVTAVREVSIALVAVFGVLVLGETFELKRMACIVAILIGISLIKLG